MTYWHIETDLVALAIYFVLLMKASLLNKEKEFTDRIFGLSLWLGLASTLIDIFSSVIMNERMGWWIYELGMIVYGLSVPVLALVWFLYTIAVIYVRNERRSKQLVTLFAVLYGVYALIIVTNPLHELYFSLSPDIEYARGPWFIMLLVGTQTVISTIGILMLLVNFKKIPSKSTFSVLLFLHFVTAAAYYIQLAHPGWLIICSTYAVVFLVCDATFESRRRDALYRTIQDSLKRLEEEKEKELAYQEKLEGAVAEANRANQAKSEFLSRMSHDIRTPINGIRGLLAIIRQERRDEKRVDECLTKIEKASGHLLSLINDVLDMTKLESGQIVLAHEPFDLRRLVGDCYSVLAPTAAESGIQLSESCSENGIRNPYLIGSALHLRQIILNIVGNAIKYNKPGGP